MGPQRKVKMDNLTHSLFALTLARTELGRAGRGTTAALLVASASERLRRLGLHVAGQPETNVAGRLYALVEADVGAGRAHGRYNALRRRLASFLRTVDATAP